MSVEYELDPYDTNEQTVHCHSSSSTSPYATVRSFPLLFFHDAPRTDSEAASLPPITCYRTSQLTLHRLRPLTLQLGRVALVELDFALEIWLQFSKERNK